MKGQSIIFFLSGYETTATALTLLLYQLARNPRVQEKLQAELDEYFPDKVKYTNLDYLIRHIDCLLLID